MSHLWADIRYGVRMLLRRPALSIASILTFGLGIGLLATAPVAPLLYKVHPRDPVVLVTVVATLGATALVAGFLGVRRIVRLDPAAILGKD